MKNKKRLYFAVLMLICFVIWTMLIKSVDVKPIGPDGSTVGFATVNGFIHNITGKNMTLYTITDWLGLVPFIIAFCFAVLGLVQWIKRKHILKVDFSLLILGGFYIAIIAVYLLFEMVVINYRPILIEGYLEASYPSSTTMLTMCVIPTTVIELNSRIKNKFLSRGTAVVFTAFTVFMVFARFVSGVHWFTDIVGGILCSVGLVSLYIFLKTLDKANKI